MADLVITAANVAWVSGATPQLGIAAETIVAGQPIYLDTTLNQWRLAKCNVAGKWPPTALALSGANAGGFFFFAQPGSIVNIGAVIVKNTTYFLSGANAGGIAPLADIAAGWNTITIGIGVTTANMLLTFYNTGIVD